jgi:hypothetical protein
MTRFIVAGCLVAFVACAPQDQQEETSATQETATPPAVTLADFAGTWNMRALTETGDSVVIEYQMTASTDPAGWTIVFPDREPIPMTVTLDGDSIMGHAGPYPSALRADVNVTTDVVTRLVGGQLQGTVVARYQTTSPDSVVRLRIEGTRAQ